MAKYSSTIQYNLKTTLDASGIQKLQTELIKTKAEIEKLSAQQLITPEATNKAISDIEKVSAALKSSFNSSLGMLDFGKFSSTMSASNLSLSSLQKSFSAAGTTGTKAFNSLLGSIGKFDTGIKTTSSTVDKLVTSLGNTVRWGITSRIVNGIADSFSQAVQYAQDLDDSLTQIMLVTDYSREEMNEYAKSANEAAKALGATTTEMTNATLIFAQQGFNLEESDQLAQLSTKLANASQQSTSDTSDQITAYMNAYGLSGDMEALSKAMDSWAEVANVSAADVGEIAEASQKVASTANTTGVTMDQLNAQIAAIESVTRDAPESIGNGLKTIYARFSDLQAGETLDDNVSLGTVTSMLSKMGVEVLDGDGKMRGVGDIMEDLMDVWSSIDSTQKAAVAQTLAGKNQLARFEALMNASDLYDSYKSSSENADGTLDQMNEEAVNSLAGKTKQIQASLEGVFKSLFDTDTFYPVLDFFRDAIDLVEQFSDAVGGGKTILLSLGSVAANVFKNQIASNIANIFQNDAVSKMQKANIGNRATMLENLGIQNVRNENTSDIIDAIDVGTTHAGSMTSEQMEAYTRGLQGVVDASNAVEDAQENLKNTVMEINTAFGENIVVLNKEKNAIEFLDMEHLSEKMVTPESLDKAQSIKDYVAVIKSEIADAEQAYVKLQNSEGKTKEETAKLKNEFVTFFSLMQSDLNTLNEDFDYAFSDEDLQVFGKYLDKINNNMDVTQEETNKVLQVLTRVKEVLGEIDKKNTVPSTFKAGTTGEDITGKVGAANAEAAGAVQNKDSQNAAMESLNKALNAQENIEQIMALTSGIVGLASAWTSFQNLGSLLADDDISVGEKTVQVVTNLVFGIAQLASAYKTLKGLELAETFSNLASAFSAVAAGEGLAATGAVALKAALGPIALIIGAITAAAINFFSQKNEERIKKITEAADSAKDSISSLKSSVSSFDDLYRKYKNGEASSDDLKSAASSLNETLENQSLNVYAATENWTAYSKALDEAAKKKLKEDAENLWNERNENAKAGTEGFERYASNGDSDYELVKFKGTSSEYKGELSAKDRFIADYGEDFSGIHIDTDGNVSASPTLDDEQVYEQLNNIVKAYEEAGDEIKGLTEEDQKEIKKYVDAAKKALSDNESYQTVREDDQALGSTYAQLYKDNPDYAYTEGTSIEDYKTQVKKQFKEDGIEASSTLIDSFVQGMMEFDLDSSKALLEQYSKETADSTFKDAIKGSNFSDDNVTNTLLDNAGISADDVSASSVISKEKEQAADYLLSMINEAKNLTDEEKIQLKDLVSTSSGSIEEMAALVKTGLEQGLDAAKAQASGSTGDDSVQTQLDSRLSDLGVTDATRESYQETLTEQGKLNQQTEEYTDTLEKEKEELERVEKECGKNSKEYTDQAKKVKKAEKALDSYKDTQEDIADKSLRTQKGLEELSESMEDYGDTLRDGDKTSLDYTEALDSVRTGLADVLNISEDAISNDFIENNLDTIQKVADGDKEALAELRSAAGQEIAAQINAEGNLTPEHLDLLNSKAQELSGLDLEVGASLNDQDLIDGLNSMLANGEMTADEMQSYLSSIGYEPDVTTQDGPPVTTKVSFSGIDIPLLGKIGAVEGTLTTTPQVPKITDIKSTGTGKYATTASGSGGGTKKSGGSGGGGGGGGSGSGGGSSYTPKTMKKDDSELDRYERVDTLLEGVSNDLEKIADEQDRLIGTAVTDNMMEQCNLLEKQASLYQQKLEIQKQEAEELRNQLANDYGITFDADGYIANYASVYNSLYDEYSRLVDQYNATTDEAGQESLEESIDNIQDKMDKFDEAYQRYDELWSGDLKDTLKQLEDIEDQIEDMQADAFNTFVEGLDDLMDINDTLDDINEAYEKLGRGTLKEDPFSQMQTSAEKLKRYYDNNFSEEWYDGLTKTYSKYAAEATTEEGKNFYNTMAQRYQDAKKHKGDGTINAGGSGYLDMSLDAVDLIQQQIQEFKTTGTSSIFGKNSSALYEAAQTVYEQFETVISDMADDYEELHDQILDGIEDMADKMEDRKEVLEDVNEELEHMQNVIEAVHGEKAYEQLNQILQARYNNYQVEINELQRQKQIWENMLKNMQEGSEEWDETSEKIKDATSEINELIEESLDSLKEQYDNTVNSLVDSWFEQTIGTSDLDWLETEWELINRNADYYLDDVNKAYNIQKLQGKYLDLLDGSDNLAIQQKITAQMNEQLNKLREKTNLSEYDVKYAEAQLEILQKQIALEEARNNKNNMKLRRDSQGNYSYVYTADESNTRSAESDLLDAQNNAYNLSKDQMVQTQEDSLSALTDAKSKMIDIWTDAALTVEERKSRVQTVIDSLKEYLDATSEQLSTSQQNLIQDFIGMCEILTEKNAEDLQKTYDDIVNGNDDAFKKIDERWSTSIKDWNENVGSFKESLDNLNTNLNGNATKYTSTVSEMSKKVQQNFDDMSATIKNATELQDALTVSADAFYAELSDKSGAIVKYDKQIQEMSKSLNDANNDLKAAQTTLNNLSNELQEQKSQNIILANKNKELAALANSGSGSGGSGSGSDLNNLHVGSIVGYRGRYYFDSWGASPSDSLYSGVAGGVVVDGSSSTKYGGRADRTGDFDVHIKSSDGKYSDLGWVKRSQLFDTGGYTGSWFGSGMSDAKDGKLAFLHQKELVLNSSDTENILAAVEAVRGFADGIKNGALGVFSSMLSGIDASAVSASSDIQQEVHITAEFPNANSAAEIEEALLNIAQRSTQYIAKTR